MPCMRLTAFWVSRTRRGPGGPGATGERRKVGQVMDFLSFAISAIGAAVFFGIFWVESKIKG